MQKLEFAQPLVLQFPKQTLIKSVHFGNTDFSATLRNVVHNDYFSVVVSVSVYFSRASFPRFHETSHSSHSHLEFTLPILNSALVTHNAQLFGICFHSRHYFRLCFFSHGHLLSPTFLATHDAQLSLARSFAGHHRHWGCLHCDGYHLCIYLGICHPPLFFTQTRNG